MSKFRWLLVVGAAVLAFTPAIASADLLTNVYGQSFAGQAVCGGCHGSTYGATTHGDFARPGVGQPGEVPVSMFPAGRIGLGLTVTPADVAFTLGAGTGEREYLSNAGIDGSPFAVFEGMAWDPAHPTTWEYDPAGIELGAYKCSQCHQLGVVRAGQKPLVGTFSTGATAAIDAWAKFASAPEGDPASYMDGASVQCERCHGVGLPTDASGGHWSSGVKIVGYNTLTMNRNAKSSSQRVLNSDVCGQCHGSFKTGNILGYTTDQRLSMFVTQYSKTDVPTEAQFLANPAGYKFFPNGENKGMKHSYYTEWAMSGHSWRGALTTSSPDATPYQKTGASRFSSNSSVLCNRCHTGEGYLKRRGVYIMDGWTEATANAGQLGQECAVCHISHGEDGSGLSVRKPEAAGVGSAAGYATGNTSLCEDCHNWQVEITGSPVVPTTAGRGPSHPQREIYKGRKVMFDVADAGEFMPNAKCEQCHMPATRSDYPAKTGLGRYEQQSFKRYSHRMFIMEPGDADRWNLAPWGDSCSPCHAGQTQNQLQASIDKWQTDASAANTLTLAAIAAARLRPEFGTPAGAELAGRAYVNQKAYQNDASGGVHNPPYEMAGLKVATFMADAVGGAFSQMYASNSVSSGSVASIAGHVAFGTGAPATGAKVALEKSSGGTWVQVGNTVVDANGNFGFMVAPSATTTYRVRWDRSGNNLTDLYSVTDVITVTSTGPAVVRNGGANRFEVAVNIAETLRVARSRPFTNVIVASGENRAMADPLGAAGLASAYDAPLLLSPASYSSTALLDELKRLRNANGGRINIHVVGGTGSINSTVYKAIAATRGTGTVERINGTDRYDLAARMALRTKSVVEGGGGTIAGVLVVNIENSASFNDALAASTISAHSHLPLIGVRATSVPSQAAAALSQFTIKPKYAVNSAFLTSGVRTATGCSATMANSTNREVAAVDIAEFGVGRALISYKNVGLVNKLSDALPAGAMLGQVDGVLLYTPYKPLSSTTSVFVQSIKAGVSKGWIFGGPATIADSTATQFYNALQ